MDTNDDPITPEERALIILITSVLVSRRAAKEAKEYQEADYHRSTLQAAGVEIQDNANGSVFWSIKGSATNGVAFAPEG